MQAIPIQMSALIKIARARGHRREQSAALAAGCKSAWTVRQSQQFPGADTT
jgi:hypothetical protein